ncbi:MAG TPA: hypothetical protein VFV25_05765 [Methylibium sp.]
MTQLSLQMLTWGTVAGAVASVVMLVAPGDWPVSRAAHTGIMMVRPAPVLGHRAVGDLRRRHAAPSGAAPRSN